MSFTLVNSNITSNNGGGTTLGVAVAGIHVGDVIFVTGSGFGSGITMTCSDGTTTLTPLTALNSSNNGDRIRGFYLLSSVASGSVTYTITYSSSASSRSICVYAFTPSGTASFDKENGTEAVATTAGISGNVTTTIADQLCFGSQVNENQSASSPPSEAINSVARTAVIDSGTHSTLWYTLPSATFTGQAAETIQSSTRILTIIATFGISGPPPNTVAWYTL